MAKPDAWRTEMLSILPEKLLLGERNLTIAAVGIGVSIVWLGVSKSGAWWPVVTAAGIAWILASNAILYRMWKADPWMSRVYSRFRLYPSFIPAHASIASSPSLRSLYRKRNHFKR